MTEEMHPEVAAVLQQAQRLQSLMDEQLHRMNSQTFTATDEAETVEVTLNGHHHLTGTFIEDGLLRLGAAVMEITADLPHDETTLRTRLFGLAQFAILQNGC